MRFHGFRLVAGHWEWFASARHLCGLHMLVAHLALSGDFVGEWTWTAW